MIIINGLEMPKENKQLDIVIHPHGKVCYCLDLECEQIATATPVKHAHWIHEHLASTSGGSYAVVRCSNCLSQYPMTEENYCPHCGAKMDEVTE